MIVLIPALPIMMDDQFYEDAMEFRPERFLEENGGVKKYFNRGVYWAYGDGPRMCLGEFNIRTFMSSFSGCKKIIF